LNAEPRLFCLDNLRVVLTILVIVHHVGQAYGPTGLFFMISGFFMAGACERGSPRAFVLGRLRRLGIPVLVFAALMLPARIFLFGEKIAGWQDLFNAEHLWYLEHLLLAGGQSVLGLLLAPAAHRSPADGRPRSAPGAAAQVRAGHGGRGRGCIRLELAAAPPGSGACGALGARLRARIQAAGSRGQQLRLCGPHDEGVLHPHAPGAGVQPAVAHG
jgi:hypothetical protein